MGKLGLTETYEEMVEKYGKENADFLASTSGTGGRTTAVPLPDHGRHATRRALIEDGRAERAKRGWSFEVREGSMTLLRKLFNGPWDEDFVVVPPGRGSWRETTSGCWTSGRSLQAAGLKRAAPPTPA